MTTAAPAWASRIVAGRVQQFYSEIGVALPDGTGEAMVSCFANPGAHANDDRNKSCSVNLLTGQWCCHGCGEQGNAYYAATARGVLDADAAELAKKHHLFIGAEEPSGNFTMGGVRQWQRWVDALWDRPELIERLGEVKGWRPGAIRRLGVGWDGSRLTFVIRRFKGNTDTIVGVVRYLPGGKPKTIAMPGSERTLFPMPEELGRSRPLFLVEGEPDAVAIRSTGHQGVAIPGASKWRSEWMLRLSNFKQLIFLGDCDPPGRELAAKIKATSPRIQVVDLDPSRDDGWDVGDLLREATQADGLEAGAWQVKLILDGLTREAVAA